MDGPRGARAGCGDPGVPLAEGVEAHRRGARSVPAPRRQERQTCRRAPRALPEQYPGGRQAGGPTHPDVLWGEELAELKDVRGGSAIDQISYIGNKSKQANTAVVTFADTLWLTPADLLPHMEGLWANPDFAFLKQVVFLTDKGVQVMDGGALPVGVHARRRSSAVPDREGGHPHGPRRALRAGGAIRPASLAITRWSLRRPSAACRGVDREAFALAAGRRVRRVVEVRGAPAAALLFTADYPFEHRCPAPPARGRDRVGGAVDEDK